MIRFKDSEPTKSKEATPKAGAKPAETKASETMPPEDATDGPRKTTAPKRKKFGAG